MSLDKHNSMSGFIEDKITEISLASGDEFSENKPEMYFVFDNRKSTLESLSESSVKVTYYYNESFNLKEVISADLMSLKDYVNLILNERGLKIYISEYDGFDLCSNESWLSFAIFNDSSIGTQYETLCIQVYSSKKEVEELTNHFRSFIPRKKTRSKIYNPSKVMSS